MDIKPFKRLETGPNPPKPSARSSLAQVSTQNTVIAHVTKPCCQVCLPQMASKRHTRSLCASKCLRAIRGAMSISTRFESAEATKQIQPRLEDENVQKRTGKKKRISIDFTCLS